MAYINHSEDSVTIPHRVLKKIKQTIPFLKTAGLVTMLGFCLEHTGALEPFMALSVSAMQTVGTNQIKSEYSSQSRNSDIAVVTINQAYFENRYGERSPLNRCALEGDISQILNQNPKQVMIDLDLSPLRAESPEEATCQSKLDIAIDFFTKKKLVENASLSPMVVLQPFNRSDDTQNTELHRWKEDRKRAGVIFADGEIISNWGVSYQFQKSLQFADLAINANPSHQEKIDEHTRSTETPKGSAPYNFKAFLNDPPDSVEFPLSQPQRLNNKIVFLGGVWGAEEPTKNNLPSFGDHDRFLTPIGVLEGIYLHSAKLVSLRSPIEINIKLHLAIDFLAGLLFAFLAEKFFENFRRNLKNNQVFAGDWLVSYFGYLLIFSVFGLLCICTSYFFLLYFGQQTYPLIIVLFLGVDALIFHPIEELAHEAHSAHHGSHKPSKMNQLGQPKKNLAGHLFSDIWKTYRESWLRTLISMCITVWFVITIIQYNLGVH